MSADSAFVEYSSATKSELWKEVKELRELLADAPSTEPGECDANCSPLAAKHLRINMHGAYELKPFGVQQIPYYVRGPVAKFCPFCGRKLRVYGP